MYMHPMLDRESDLELTVKALTCVMCLAAWSAHVCTCGHMWEDEGDRLPAWNVGIIIS